MIRKIASIKEILNITPIENADSIELATIDGWQSVIKKGQFRIGDWVVFCEPDAVLPERPEFEFMRAKHFRIKTCRLRGVLSQGICFPLNILPDGQYNIGDDVSELLDIHKYEPPIPVQLRGRVRCPIFRLAVPKTDEVRVQNIPKVLERHRGKNFIVTEKLDGCLGRNAKIKTEIGDISIGRIVKERMPVKILSYNEKTHSYEYKDILEYHEYKHRDNLYKIGVKSIRKGRHIKYLICTDNHKFLVGNEWIRSDSLVVGNKIKHYCNAPDEQTQQVILGSLLGDGTIIRGGKSRTIEFSTTAKKQEYFDYRLQLLGEFGYSRGYATGGYSGTKVLLGASKSNVFVSEMIQTHCELYRKKYVTDEWCNVLNPLGLAIWYMDDGSISNRDGVKQRPRMHLHTNSESLDEVKRLVDMLNNKFGIECAYHENSGYPTITITADGTEMFSELIYPYVCSCMKYKLPIKYEQEDCILTNKRVGSIHTTLETEVVSIEKLHTHRNVFDLSIADNHNYFANDILTHNTSMSVYLDPETGLHVCSRNIDLAPDYDHPFNGDSYWRYAMQYNLEEVLKTLGNSIALQGELIGPGIQKNKYGLKDLQYKIFNFWDMKNHCYLDHQVMEDTVEAFGLGKDFLVPRVEDIILNHTVNELLELADGKSKLADVYREGLVFRPEHEDVDWEIGRLSFKSISPTFLLKHGE